ncbi:RHS repeat-associated core domain-containing protein [Hazenella sp. IB182353]|uniref:RHS repeat-associated core domain-containing protein n=1 Tax=Polycladospora coralii TaxID=2771432 RepID=UPI001BCCFE43|nr:RHS repeat-associated core domain-containing protein [Polycladospora coralii]MBS7532022.1 RHS repeat-associated core domain-containing protein [Polycladospora coralii]
MYNPYRYSGKRWDPNTESYDLGFRNYFPGTGRFMSPDSYTNAKEHVGLFMNAMTNSLYGYAGGNPISYIDPDGHLPVEVGSDPYSEAYSNPLKVFKKANGGVGYGATIPATSSLRSKPPKTHRVHRKNGTGSSGRSGGVFTAPKPVYTKTSLLTMAGGSCERTLAGCPYQPDAITNFIDSFTPEERLDFIFMVMDAATVIDLLLVSHGGVALLSQGAKGVLKQGLKESAKKQAAKETGKSSGKSSANASAKSGSAKNLVGKDFEDHLTKKLGGNGGFQKGGRDFDGGVDNRWWEAKSAGYWENTMKDPKRIDKFKSDMGSRLRIAKENGASYELHSNTPIPSELKSYLNKKGINYYEWLD